MQKCVYSLYNVIMVSSVQNATRTDQLRLAALAQQKVSENVQKLMEKQQVRSVPLVCALNVTFFSLMIDYVENLETAERGRRCIGKV